MATPSGVIGRILGAVKIGRLYLSHRKGLTAHAGGGQTSAVALDRVMNSVSTVGTTADSVKLPPCEESRVVLVVNNGANSMTVYSQESSGVTINATAGSTGVAQAAGISALYFAVEAGKWNRILSA